MEKNGQASQSMLQENWLFFTKGDVASSIAEAPLYTDAQTRGEGITVGPYTFINTLSWFQGEEQLLPSIVLRVAFHAPAKLPSMKASDYDHYHGGDYLDEIAALVSLFLGTRVSAGGVERVFQNGGDPLGRPERYWNKPAPILSPSRRKHMPQLGGPRLLGGLAGLDGLVDQPGERVNALIKSARLYQQAVLIADSDPSTCWLLLVSAIETAAVQWRSEISPEEQLRDGLPKLDALLVEKAPHIRSEVAKLLRHLTGATKRFVAFLTEFAPPEPLKRPPQYLRLDYSNQGIKRVAKVVYDHRSKALHDGVAFPAPMCEPPEVFEASEHADAGAVQEIPAGLASHTKGATWHLNDTPVMLSTFEYLTRNSILNWWRDSGRARNELPQVG